MATLAAWVAVPLVAAGQSSAIPQFDASGDVVNLWVSVRDAEGAPVEGLRREDFVLLDGGRRRPLEFLARQNDYGADAILALDVALVLDTSGSMMSEIRRMRFSALRFLERVPLTQQLTVSLFDHRTEVARYEPAKRDTVNKWIDDQLPGGGTAVYDALAETLRLMGSGNRRRVLVLLSDGLDESSRLTLDGVTEKFVRAGATLYALQFRGELASRPNRRDMATAWNALERLTSATGGLLLRVDKVEPDLLFDQILGDIGSQYALGFTPEPGKRFRKLRVLTNRRGVKTRYRDGYYPPPAR